MTTIIYLLKEDPRSIALAAMLLLSLVLPLMAGGGSEATRGARVRTALAGQLMMALCGLLIIAFPRFAVIGFALAALVCALFARKLRRQMRPAQNNG